MLVRVHAWKTAQKESDQQAGNSGKTGRSTRYNLNAVAQCFYYALSEIRLFTLLFMLFLVLVYSLFIFTLILHRRGSHKQEIAFK